MTLDMNCTEKALHSLTTHFLPPCDNQSLELLGDQFNWISPSSQMMSAAILEETNFTSTFYGNATSAISVASATSTAIISSLSSSPQPNTVDPEYRNFLTLTRFWIQRVFVPILMVIGVLGNSMTIIIMTRPRMRSSTNCYLAALATFDMLYLVFSFLLSLNHYPNMTDVKYRFYWQTFPFLIMIADACTNISVWLTVTFTIERYIVVSHPIKGKVICTESRARKVILCVFLICFTIAVPTPFEWEIVEELHPQTNRTLMVAKYSDLGNNLLYKMIASWFISILFIFIPLFLLAIFNLFLIRSVHISRKRRNVMTQSKISYAGSAGKAGNRRQSDTNASNTTVTRQGNHRFDHSSKQEAKITLMLIAVVILFLVCHSPVAGMLLYTSFRNIPENSNQYYLTRGLNNIFNLLVGVHCAGNFVLYCLLCQKYRRTLVQIFCPCLRSRLGRLQSSYVHSTIGVGNSRFDTNQQYLQQSNPYQTQKGISNEGRSSELREISDGHSRSSSCGQQQHCQPFSFDPIGLDSQSNLIKRNTLTNSGRSLRSQIGGSVKQGNGSKSDINGQ